MRYLSMADNHRLRHIARHILVRASHQQPSIHAIDRLTDVLSRVNDDTLDQLLCQE